MTDALASVVFFCVGFTLAIRVIAALYRPLDLWYTIGTVWPYAVRGILVWPAITILLFHLLVGSAQTGYVIGFVAFSAYFLFSKTILRLVLRRFMVKYRRPQIIE